MSSLKSTVAPFALMLIAMGAAAAPAGARVAAVFPAEPGQGRIVKTVTATGVLYTFSPAPARAVRAPEQAGAASMPRATAAASLSPSVSALPPAATLALDPALRSRIRYETVHWRGKPVQTLDEASRLLLAQAAARKAGLHEVGLDFHDVYGIIEAETSWIARAGASKDGTVNLGLAQFEPRTARGLGVTDPDDPVQAVFGAAAYIKDGARWAHGKLAGLNLPPAERAAKIREGISVHYNLSVKGRNKWDGRNTATLPIETQRHIRNARAGAAQAVQLAKLVKA